MSNDIERIARTLLRSEYVSVSRRDRRRSCRQTAYPVAQQSKMPLLLDLLDKEDFERVLVFTDKRGADCIAHVLEKRSHKSTAFMATVRSRVVAAFKSGHTGVLSADVAARGIVLIRITCDKL